MTEEPRLVKNTAATVVLRLTGAAMSFGIGIIAARLTELPEYGGYAYTMSIVSVAAVVGTIGLDRLVVRKIAAAQNVAGSRDTRGFVTWAQLTGVAAALLVIAVGALIWLFIKEMFDQPTRRAMTFGGLLLPLMVWLRVQQSALQGQSRMIAGQLPESVVQPGVVALMLGIVALAGASVSSRDLIGMQVVGAAVGCVAAAVLVYRSFNTGPAEERESGHREWTRDLVPLMLTGVLSVAVTQADMLILGGLKGARAAGVYSAASRSAALIGFIFASANVAMAPTFAALHARGDKDALQYVVTRSARFILFATTIVAVLMVLGGRALLLVFGAEFEMGFSALRILSAGQWANAAAGSVAFLLMMTGHARDVTTSLAIGLVLNLILSTLLIPVWGIDGAATAQTATIIFWNVLLMWFVRHRLGIDPTAAGVNATRSTG